MALFGYNLSLEPGFNFTDAEFRTFERLLSLLTRVLARGRKRALRKRALQGGVEPGNYYGLSTEGLVQLVVDSIAKAIFEVRFDEVESDADSSLPEHYLSE